MGIVVNDVWRPSVEKQSESFVEKSKQKNLSADSYLCGLESWNVQMMLFLN